MASLEHHLPYTEPVNEAVEGPLLQFFESLGITDFRIFQELFLWYNGQYPITDQLLQSLVLIVVVSLFLMVYSGRLTRIPSGFQHFLEVTVIGFRDMLETTIGPGGSKHMPFMLTIGLYIFLGNLIGLFPFSMSPTANLNVTASCAILSFFYYNLQGIKTQGILAYLGHFFGPHLPWYLKPINLLMFPIEIISHLARPLSLAIRLFGNIMGEDLVLIILASLVPLFIPVPMMLFMVFTSFLQAFVFVMLSVLYVAGAVAEEH